MPDNRTTKEMMASIETSILYIDNHLKNIDSHLEKLNNRTEDCEIGLTKNSERIALIYEVFGGLFGGGIIVAIILKVLGVF